MHILKTESLKEFLDFDIVQVQISTIPFANSQLMKADSSGGYTIRYVVESTKKENLLGFSFRLDGYHGDNVGKLEERSVQVSIECKDSLCLGGRWCAWTHGWKPMAAASIQ